MPNYITILDFIILPFLLLIVYGVAYRYRDKKYPLKYKHPYRKYFIPALTLKITGAILIGLIYQYYYKGGDTFNFFRHSQIINSALPDSFIKWVNLLFRVPNETSLGYYEYIRYLTWYNDPSSYMVSSIAAFISIFFGTTYLPTAIIFALLSFSGSWAMFRAFAGIYPTFIRQLAIAILYLPSVIIWGSGIFKDTLCLASLGWLTYSVFQIMVKRNFSPMNIMTTIISLYLTYIIKPYILMAFIPALLIWILFIYTRNIRNTAIKIIINLSFLFLTGFVTFYAINSLGEKYLGKYSMENITKTAEVTRGWISYASGDEGSAYDLGEAKSAAQMFTKLPLAVNVTLFRPYLWESRKIIVLLSAIEAFVFLFLTLKVLYVVGVKKVWQTIAKDPTIQFCLIFTIIFAFAVGITSYNFGALSRYKIPCLPFYALSILLIYYKNVSAKRPLLKLIGI